MFTEKLMNFFSDVHRINEEWDKMLNDLINNHDIVIDDPYWVKINGIKVWVQNYPYAFGKPENFNFLPSRKTRRRLYNTIKDRLPTKDRHAVAQLREKMNTGA